MLLTRTLSAAALIAIALTSIVWFVSILPAPHNQTSEIVTATIALPYYVFMFIPTKVVHALNFIAGGAIPEQTVPPPFTWWLARGSLSFERELFASVTICAIGALIYGLFWYMLSKSSPKHRVRFALAMAIAVMGVMARIPASMLATPGPLAEICDFLGRILTVGNEVGPGLCSFRCLQLFEG